MFVTSTYVGVSQRVVATLVACALVLTSIGLYQTAQAANLTDISDTLSDSDVSVASSHTIQFTVPTGSVGIAGTDNITITWDSQDDGAVGQDFGAIATIVDSSNLTYSVNAGAAAAPTFVSSDADSLTINGIVAVAGDVVEIVVAEAAGVTNPATIGSYEMLVEVANADADQGRTRVAIVENVLVTAVVDTIFEFVVTGLATSTAINGETTTGSTTPTAIDFGQILPGPLNAEVLGQQLNVTSNAINGFVVTVEQDDDLLSSTGADIDGFADAAYNDDPSLGAWVSPTNDIADENTWGHWGLTSADGNIHGAGTAFTGVDQFIAASTTPRVIFAHNGPSDGVLTGGTDATTDDVGQTLVAYKIEITSLQEAGDDYNTTLTYIATPTF